MARKLARRELQTTPNLPVGLALVRDAEVIGAEPFFHEFIAGMERTLVPHGIPVLLQVVATLDEAAERIRAWVESGQVQGALLIDLLPGDKRVTLVSELELPTVVIGDPATANGLTAVWTQDELAMRDVVTRLDGGGHRRVGHVAGPAQMAHTIIRRQTFLDVASELGLLATTFEGDYSEAAGAAVITALLALTDRPTALIFDNDLMALGALNEAARAGLAVPDELSLVAWDDSALCQLAVPALSAVSHDVQALGELVGDTVLGVLAGDAPRVVTAAPAVLVIRESVQNID